MKTLFAAGMAAASLLLAPALAHADDVFGPNVVVGPNVQVGPGITFADPVDAAAQAAAGREPCFAPDGSTYYTPADAPCS
jgi:hypothetical protein